MNNHENCDNQSILSDITDCFGNITISSDEIAQKLDEINTKTETELNKLTIEVLKEKCKELNIGSISKLKKPELISALLSKKQELWTLIKDKKMPDLKNICKTYNIKNVSGLKKFELCYLILDYCSTNLKFKIEETPTLQDETKQKNTNDENVTTIETKKLSPLEELEKQKKEIELKMKNELEKQKKIEDEQKRIENEQKKQKKQSIPKNVRIIVWNHYIGDDIIKHRCLCCKKVLISNTNFEVGHVISEKNGGTHEINNLRPICFACNHSMGAENMIEFVVKFGLYIG